MDEQNSDKTKYCDDHDDLLFPMHDSWQTYDGEYAAQAVAAKLNRCGYCNDNCFQCVGPEDDKCTDCTIGQQICAKNENDQFGLCWPRQATNGKWDNKCPDNYPHFVRAT